METDPSYRLVKLREVFPQMRARFPAVRRHLVMDEDTLEHSIAAWEERWPLSLQGRFRL